MFKNLSIYRIQPPWLATAAEMQDTLAKARFVACGATQPQAVGWVPPRGKDGAALVETVGGQQLLALMVERKLLPASVVKSHTDALAAQVEKETGRKPGKKLKQELKEQALLDLLPQAFTKRATVHVWIDPDRQLLMIDTASQARADELVTQLVQALPGLAPQPVHTAQTPAAVMAHWLLEGDPPAAFSVDRECELKAEDEMQSAVRYARHRLDTDEVRQHIRGGKRPTRLALTWQGRVSFVLTDAGQIRKLDFLDVVFENKPSAKDADEAFDADGAIATGELRGLIPDLVEALGGEQQPGSAESAA